MLPEKLIEIGVHARNIVNFDFRKKQSDSNGTSEQISDAEIIERFYQQREAAQRLVEDYIKDPSNLTLLGRSQKVVEQLELIENSSEEIGHRAKVTVAIMSGRMRRTQFTAYIAGKYSTSNQIPGTFKSWLHNAAANGSIDLMSCIDDTNEHLDNGLKKLFKEKEQVEVTLSLLRMFERGAREDASRFLDIADELERDSPLTLFNRARLEAYKGNEESAMKYIEDIPLPQKNEHPARLLWHLDNISSYEKDSKFQKLLVRKNNHFHTVVYEKLKTCASYSEKYITERGGKEKMWSEMGMSEATKKDFKYTKALMASCGAGIAVLTVIGQMDEATAQSALLFIQNIFEHLDLIASAEAGELFDSVSTANLSLGDGGWAHNINYEQGIVAATFGDGGWA